MCKTNIILIGLFLISYNCQSQTIDSTVVKARIGEEVKFLKARFAIDSSQERKLYTKLYEFYTTKEVSENKKSKATVENAQTAYEAILKKELTAAQFKQYNELKKQQQALYEQRMQRKKGADSTHH